MTYSTDQEAFWAGEFGSEYIRRNDSTELLASNLSFFSRALRCAGRINSCIEFGANIGMNLRALRLLYPAMHARAIEINARAVRQLSKLLGAENVFEGSIFNAPEKPQADLVLIKGVLIHVNPDRLNETYDKLYAASRRWVLVCEYYNPTPVTVPYRGHDDRLFKRDFAGEILERFPALSLVDYGFVYHRDTAFPQDDINWFLMRRE